MRPRLPLLLALISPLLLAPRLLATKSSNWTDVQGATFRAEPVEALGPFALFNVGGLSSRRILLRGLAPDECRRFYQETAGRPRPADLWTQAKGEISGELPGHVLRVSGKTLVPVDLTGRPEPQVFVLLFGSHNDGESWGMVNGFIPTYNRIQQIYPGRSETIFFGVRDKPNEHLQIATETYMPWLVADFVTQDGLSSYERFAPHEGILMLAVSRDGVPLLASRAENVEAVKQFIDGLSDLLRILDPTNPAIWRDRVHYLDAVRPLQFAHAQAAPVLVGNPLRPDGLRQRGITRVQAHLEVGADGHVTSATVDPSGGVAPALAAPLGDALRQGTVFSPAIDQGKPVASTYDYAYEPGPAQPELAADLAWLRGDARVEIAINSWLVLAPIPVPAEDFSSVDHVDANGVTVFTPLNVSQQAVSHKSQMNAFNSDFFQDVNAVLPAEGDNQVVDDQKLTWRRLKAEDGYLNFQTGATNLDYCVGYAWTEMDLPQALEGWLGIGSDDGIKIWLNGKEVHDRWVRRISRIDDDIVPLHLVAGKNRLLIKIQNVTGEWSFICRLRVKPIATHP